jgi:hypothetical protein
MSEFDKKISALTGGSASQAGDEYVVARSGSNFKITGANVAAAATAVGTIATGTWQGTPIANAYIATGLDATKLTVGATLPSNVLASSLTSVGTLSALTVTGDLTVDTSTLKVDSANNRVGIGTASPSTTLEVAGSIYAGAAGEIMSVSGAVIYGTRTANSALFYTNNAEAMRIDASGNVTLAKDKLLGISTSDGSDNGYLALCGASADGSARGGHIYLSGNERSGATGTVAIAAGNVAGGIIEFRTGNDVERARITAGGDVAITSGAKLYLDGVAATGDSYIAETTTNVVEIYTGGSASLYVASNQFKARGVAINTTGSAANVWVDTTTGDMARSTSSLRYKHDIATLDADDAISAVLSLRPITYRGITDKDQRQYVGFVAEEVQQVAPLLCTYDEGGEEGTPNYVTYDRVAAYLVCAIQKQHRVIESLEARLDALEN